MLNSGFELRDLIFDFRFSFWASKQATSKRAKDERRRGRTSPAKTANRLEVVPFTMTMAETTPTRRRPESGIGNEEILATIANENIANDSDDSKKRRHIHVEMGPLVVSGAALDRVRARFVSL